MTSQVLRRKLKHFTLQKACRKLKYRLWFTDSILLLTRPAGPPAEPSPRKPFAGEIRCVTEADLPDCAAFENPDRYVPIYRSMLKRGDLALFGYLDGRCVFRSFLQRSGPLAFQEHTVRELAAGKGYVHYIFCAPDARRKGFHEAALREMCRICPDRTLYAEVKEGNIPSLRGFFRSGFAPAARLTAKNRFFRSMMAETPLSVEETAAILENTMKKEVL